MHIWGYQLHLSCRDMIFVNSKCKGAFKFKWLWVEWFEGAIAHLSQEAWFKWFESGIAFWIEEDLICIVQGCKFTFELWRVSIEWFEDEIHIRIIEDLSRVVWGYKCTLGWRRHDLKLNKKNVHMHIDKMDRRFKGTLRQNGLNLSGLTVQRYIKEKEGLI